jgi:nucleotide-binding universal stress UspA family protein
MFSTIVIGFDGSSAASDALTLALALAEPETELVVCCVHPPELPEELVPDQHLRAEAEQRLHAARTRLGDRPHTRFVVRAAFSAGAGLHEEAVRRDADLIVVGSSHRGGIGRVLMGSVTQQVLAAPPCAVAVASGSLRLHEDLALRELGVAFDGREESRIALRAAADLARERRARLRLITVVEPQLHAAGWASAWVYADLRDELVELAEREAREAIERWCEGVETSFEVVVGRPVPELVLASSRFDVLVLGSRGYGPLRRVLLGTVSGRVVEAAASPVLVLPRGAHAGDTGERVAAGAAERAA